MSEETKTRLKRFLQDQEESVQLARGTPECSDQIRVDAINAALSLACTNSSAEREPVSMEEIIKSARLAERFLKGD